MTLIDQLILEMVEALARIDAPLEGYRDNQRSLVAADGDATILFVNQAIAEYVQRQAYLTAALAALRALSDDAYPTDLHFSASLEVAERLAGQVASQNAAFATITPVGEATSATVNLGTVTPI